MMKWSLKYCEHNAKKIVKTFEFEKYYYCSLILIFFICVVFVFIVGECLKKYSSKNRKNKKSLGKFRVNFKIRNYLFKLGWHIRSIHGSSSQRFSKLGRLLSRLVPHLDCCQRLRRHQLV